MRIRVPTPRSGIALIIVLVVIVVLGILAGGFAYSMKVETTLARRAVFSSDLDWAGRGGVEVAKWILAQSGQGPDAQVDSLKQKWAGGPGDTNGALASIDLKNIKIGEVTLAIDIKDLDRKFNINVADETILREALTLIGVDASAIPTIVASILDWRDLDNDPHMNGAEKDYYERMDTPYWPKNGPIDDLSELLLVKGVTPAMYMGSSGGAVPPVLTRLQQGLRSSAFDEPTYAVGLVDLFTALSARTVNINTASASVLKMPVDPATGVAPIDDNIAQAIINTRAGLDGQDGTEDDMPFRTLADLARVPGLNPAVIGLFGRYFNTRSLVFEVHVTVTAGGGRRECVAILRRNSPKDIQTLNMYWK